MAVARSRHLAQNYWPGFVDALAAILMVAVFLIMVFALAQFSFSELLSRSEGEVSALESRLTAMQSEVLDLRSEAERGRSLILTAQDEAQAERARAGGLALRLTESEDRTARAIEELSASETRILELVAAVAVLEETVETGQRGRVDAERESASLEDQLARLSGELATLSATLASARTRSEDQRVEIEDLSLQLTQALATRVEELESYRSEFFGRLRELLGDQEGILVVGDRFVLQSEILFPSGQAELGGGGRLELANLATTLREISADIPPDINWILRVGGHTDIQPIATGRFPSNWHLSTARALEVVRFLVGEGIPPDRLMAAGFGEFQPLDFGGTVEALARNRRIEFKLTEQ